MGKVLSRITPILLSAFLAAESAVCLPEQVYACEDGAALFECEDFAIDETAQEEEAVEIEEVQLEETETEETEIEETEFEDVELEESETEEADDETDSELTDEEDIDDAAFQGEVTTRDEVFLEGKCGDNLQYQVINHYTTEVNGGHEFTSKKVIMKISGSGEMYDYSKDNLAPWASEWTNVSEITFEEGITSIGDYAFCMAIRGHVVHSPAIKLPSTVKRVGNYAFYGTDLRYVKLPEVMDSVGDCAFANCSLSTYANNEVVFPKTIRYIGKYAFAGAPFKNGIEFNGTEVIDDSAFSGCKISGITFSDSLKKIGSEAFKDVKLSQAELTFPVGLEYIGDRAFYNAKAYKVAFRGDVPETLGKDVFLHFGAGPTGRELVIRYPVEYHKWEEVVNGDYTEWTGREVQFEAYKSILKAHFHDPYGNVIEQIYTTESVLVAPELVLKEGDKLYGWYSDAYNQCVETRWNFETEIKDDVDLYARLETADCRVMFDTGCDAVVPYQIIPGGKTAVMPARPKCDGKIFVRWEDKNAPGKEFDFRTPLYEDTTLVAVWREPGVVTCYGYKSSVEFTGFPVTFPDLKVFLDEEELAYGRDYTVDNHNSINAGIHSFAVKLQGDYSGTIGQLYFINRAVLSDDPDKTNVYFAKTWPVLKYNGKVQKPKPVLKLKSKDGEYTLKEGRDYTLTYPHTDKKYDEYDPDAYEYDPDAFKAPGEYDVVIEGKGNFAGTMTCSVTISKLKDFSKCSVKVLEDCTYTGEAEIPRLLVKYGKKVLKCYVDDEFYGWEEGDYYYELGNCVNTGIGTLYLYPVDTNTYCGVKVVHYNIVGTSIKDAEISGVEDLAYTGQSRIQKNLTVSYDGKVLQGMPRYEFEAGMANPDYPEYPDCKYTYEYINNVKIGTAKLVIKGVNGFSGEVTIPFKITKPYITKLDTIDIQENVRYSYKGAEPEVKLVDGRYRLVEGKDYSVKLSGNKKPGTGKIVIKGKGNYIGTITGTFEITANDLGSSEVTAKDITFRKSAYIKPSDLRIMDDRGNKLRVGKDIAKDITYTYAKDCVVIQKDEKVRRNAGDPVDKKDCLQSGTVVNCTIKGLSNYTGETTVTFRIVDKLIDYAKVTIKDQAYTSIAVVPDKKSIRVTLGKTVLDDDDYEIVGCTNNVRAGKATITLKGKGNYGGTVTATFNITPMKTRRY